MTHSIGAESAPTDSRQVLRGGLPDEVDALKALVIDLHARLQAQERHIERQREGLRALAHAIDAVRMSAFEAHADLNILERDGAKFIKRNDNGRNGSG